MGGSSGSTTTVEQSGPPEPLKSQLVGIGSDWLSTDPAKRQTALEQSTMDLPLYTKIGQEYADTAAGKYLDPNTNPALQNYLNTATQTANTGFQQGLANLQSTFAKGGQYSMGQSGPMAQAGKQALVQSQQGLAQAEAPALLDTYNQERGRQTAAEGAASSYAMTPLVAGTDIANMFKAGTSTSNYNQSSGGLAGILGK